MLKKQKSFKIQENGQQFETMRIGLKEHTITKDIDQFSIVSIFKPSSHQPYYAILTNHQIVYLFNHKFGINKVEEANQILLSDYCQEKVNLRLLYKLPSLLHIKMKYSHNFECIFMLLSTGQVTVFTDEFYLLRMVDIICCDSQNSIKHCLDFQYYEKQAFRQVRKIKNGFFVFLFTDSLQLHEVQIVTNHKLSKFKPSYKCHLIQLNKQVIDRQVNHPVSLTAFSLYRSHLFKDAKLNATIFLCCNCLKEAYFYLINKQTMRLQQTIKINKSQLSNANITDYQINPINKRFIIALSNGALKAISFKEQNADSVLYTMKISTFSINKIYLPSLQKLFTYSQDCIFSIVNLNTLSIEQKFKFGESLQFYFVNQHYFVNLGTKSQSSYNKRQDQQSRTLLLNEFHCKYDKIFQCNSDIIGYNIEKNGQLLQLSDNSLLINKRIGDKTEVIQTFLPPKSVSVRCISKNPFCSQDEYWILTQKSQIYKYVVSLRKVQVSQVVELHQFVDKSQIVHRYTINYFCFLTKIIPLEYDTQTTEKEYRFNQAINLQLMPLCLGTSSGEILIVTANKILNIICRIRYLSTPITNIVELHPVQQSQLSRGLIVYQSRKSNKTIMLQLSHDKPPIQLLKFNSQNNTSVKFLTKELLGMINGGTFNVFYCQYKNSQCGLYRQQHYNPGVMQTSQITAISYCCSQSKQYLMVGYSLGEILLYNIHRKLNEKTYIHLNLTYVLQISKEQPVQFVRYHQHQVYYNLGSFLVTTLINPPQNQRLTLNPAQNHRIYKLQGNKQFIQAYNVPKNINKHVKPFKQTDESNNVKLPTIKERKSRQARSSSLGIINKSNIDKPEFIFHFPDIKLYRSLITKSMIN